MTAPRSTLLTSPLSMADFAFRLVFFAVAPFAIVAAAALFPVRGALFDVGLALSVFLAGEAVRGYAARWRIVRVFLKEALDFEAFYRSRPPRRFAYYVFYPLLAPYWLVQRDARHEFLVFRSYTLAGLLLLLISLGWQYFALWQPELGWREFLPLVALAFVVETLLVLALLMPVATTVVWYHSSFRRGRLVILLAVGLASTALVLSRIALRRDPIVSYMTRERVLLRTKAAQRPAHRALLGALRAAWANVDAQPAADGDGKVEGPALDAAHDALERFYKHDEAYAFDLWASPRRHPRLLVVYFEARLHRAPIWVALQRDGKEIRSPKDLPSGAFIAMRQAADTSNALAIVWPDTDESAPSTTERAAPGSRKSPTSSTKRRPSH